MLMMRTTKTAVCFQTKAIFHHLYGFELVFWLNLISNTSPIAQTRHLEYISTHMMTMLHVAYKTSGSERMHEESE